jgi:hypothetical protein
VPCRVVVRDEGVVAHTIKVPVRGLTAEYPDAHPNVVVPAAPTKSEPPTKLLLRLQAFPIGDVGVLLRMFNGVLELNTMDSPASVVSASAPTASHPVADAPAGVVTVMLVIVIVAVPLVVS